MVRARSKSKNNCLLGLSKVWWAMVLPVLVAVAALVPNYVGMVCPQKVVVVERLSDNRFDAQTMTNSIAVMPEAFGLTRPSTVVRANLDRPETTTEDDKLNPQLDKMVDLIDFLYAKGEYSAVFDLATIAYDNAIEQWMSLGGTPLGARLAYNIRKICGALAEVYLSRGQYEEADHYAMLATFGGTAVDVPPYFHALKYVTGIRRHKGKIGVVLESDWKTSNWQNRLRDHSLSDQYRFLQIIAGWGYLPPYELDVDEGVLRRFSYRERYGLREELNHRPVVSDDRVNGGLVATAWTGCSSYESFSLLKEFNRQMVEIKAQHGKDLKAKTYCIPPTCCFGGENLCPYNRTFYAINVEALRVEERRR